MGLGGQVHDRVGLEACQHRTDGGLIDDVGLDEFVAGIGRDAGQRLEVTGIGQFVEVEHFMFGVADQVPNQGGTDKAGASGD